MLDIKVLGPGCANCSKLEQLTKQSVESMGIDAHITKVSDYAEIMEYDILSTPGLVINGSVVCSGRVPSQSEITTWLADASMESV